MLIKLGVDISRLSRPVRRVLPVIEHIFRKHAKTEPVITSTFEGSHSPGSLHYSNDAIDLRRVTESILIKDKLVVFLGDKFDVILEDTHIHIEYDP